MPRVELRVQTNDRVSKISALSKKRLKSIDDQLPDPKGPSNKEGNLFCLTMASAYASVHSAIEKATAGSLRGPYLYVTPARSSNWKESQQIWSYKGTVLLRDGCYPQHSVYHMIFHFMMWLHYNSPNFNLPKIFGIQIHQTQTFVIYGITSTTLSMKLLGNYMYIEFPSISLPTL